MAEYTGKDEILKDLKQRVEDKILEPSNYDLLKKLVENADTLDEAIKIAELGTTYRRTGFHFDKKLEKQSDAISYFKKNEELSFTTDPNTTTHKLIIGDNYPALLNLLVEYKGKIDVIYIDPPYGKDNMGEFAKTNYENAISRDNLLSMLYPRLWLARQLLTESGVIFCSIDDKNQAYVKGLFDEVFGERNADIMVWRKSGAGRDGKMKNSKTFRKDHEYILVAFKQTNELNKSLEIPQWENEYGNPDNDIRGSYKAGSISNKEEASNPNSDKYYTVVSPSGKQFTRQFNIYKDDFDALDADNRIYWGKNGDAVPAIKIFTNELREVSTSSIIDNKAMTTTIGASTLDEIIDIPDIGKLMRPKPVSLMKKLIQISSKPDSIVLDFFAGSGTTGHGVLELNKVDGGNRQFILVTNNEVTSSNPNGIAYDVTSMRLKRIMTGEDYNGDNNFKWLEKNKPYGDNLLVVDLAEVSNREAIEGKTAFDVIDETLYGQEKLDVNEKIKWVATNFEQTQKRLEEK